VRAAEQFFTRVAVLLLGACLLSVHGAQTKPPGSRAPDTVSLSEAARKSVVVVTHYGRDGKQDGVGAGFIVSADGLIATCFHVIDEARPIEPIM